jgi:methionine-gamma-lyase
VADPDRKAAVAIFTGAISTRRSTSSEGRSRRSKASGLGAISAALLQICNQGDHIVAGNTIYGGTFAFLNDYLPAKAGITTTFVPAEDVDAVARAITPKTRAIYVESVSNPTLRVADIPRLAEVAKSRGVLLVVDNTFTPMILSPIVLGADVVVHSLTKFMNGASDIIAGAIVGTTAFISSLMDLHTGSLMLLGPTMDPRTAFEISLRLPHLGLRMTEHGRRALMFAQRLKERGLSVVYPGLEDHPDYRLLVSTANEGYGLGGILGLDLETQARAEALMETLQNDERFGYMAVSLGFFDTLMSCSAATTSSELSEEDKKRAGIRPGLVGMSIGITGSLEQRWAQLETGLRRVGII